jgi:hypothetical protein
MLSMGIPMSQPAEPRNPFYLALLLVSLLFVISVLAVAVVPILEKKAAEAGNPPPPSELRDWLRSDGWQLVVGELAVIVVLAVLSMALDRLRRLQTERSRDTISPDPGAPAPGDASAKTS